MRRLFAWFEQETRGWKLIRLILLFLLADLFTSFLIGFLFRMLDIPVTPARYGKEPVVIGLGMFPWITKVLLWEEVRFRLPLAIPAYLKKRCGIDPWLIVGVAVVLSLVFSYIHDGGNRVTQVLGGLLYCGLYLKAGGWNGKVLKPFAVVLTAHLAYDLFGITLMWLGGAKTF